MHLLRWLALCAMLSFFLVLIPTPATAAQLPTVGTWHRHSGYSWAINAWDINVPGQGDCGNKVRAHHPGRVVGVFHWRTSYGKHIIILGPRGRLRYYAHLRGERVHLGEWVRRREWVGRVGTTGNSSGCHLHYEVRP